jgi:hypothetical protein
LSQAPQDLERSDEKPKSYYLSKRDLKIFGIGIVILGVVFSPVYIALKEKSDAYKCKQNIKAIANAISLYAAENNERLPPAFVTVDGVNPLVENGAVYTWAYLIHPYMKREASFKCPKAEESECYLDHDSETGKPMLVSYGMYLPMGGMSIQTIPNPDSAIVVTETISLGLRDTFDPHPYTDSEGKPVRDGFVVTWGSGNQFSLGTKEEAVTRLAYPDTKDGKLKADGASRHPEGNHFLTVSGTSITLTPRMARVEWDDKRKRISGHWAVPEEATFGPNK